MVRIQDSAKIIVVILLTFGGIASAQTPPDSVTAVALGPSAVQVTFTACLSSDEGNCNLGFFIYRNPPGFTQSPLTSAQLGQGTYVGSTQGIWMDTSVKGGQSYTYRVCTGGAAKSDGSNCTTTTTAVKVPVAPPPPPLPTVTLTAAATSILKGQQTGLKWTSTNATSLDLEPGVGKVAVPAGSTTVGPGVWTITATGPGGQATARVQITVPCLTPWSAPGNVTAVAGLSDVPLKWTNPNTSAGQACPAPSSEVLIYRMGTNGWDQLAALSKTNGTLPTHYTDSGSLQPHTGYEYEVCEGGSPNWQNPVNCASPPGLQHGDVGYGIVTWGANPVLSATRVNGNTVKLQIALDQYSVTSIVVTRQGSDDPCRQGGTLGNGLQGCPTTNGLGGSPAHTVTVYNWNTNPASAYPPGFQNSKSAPYIVSLPDDTTVKPGVEYYYLAQVVWLWTVGQDSQTVTVPNAYATAPSQQSLAGGAKSIKPNGNAPPPPLQSRTAATSVVSPTSRTITPGSTSPMMSPAGSTTAAPSQQPSQQATGEKPMMAAAPPMLLSGSSMGPSTGPLLAHPATTARPAMAPAKAITTTSPAISPAQAANLNAAIKQVQQKPNDPQTLYALGKAYCAGNEKNTGVSYMYMALMLAEQAGNAPLTGQIKASLAEQGVSAK